MLIQRDWRLFGQYAKELGFVDNDAIEQALKLQLREQRHIYLGEHLPMGPALVRLGAMTEKQASEVEGELEKDRLKHLDPVSHFSPATKFGARLLERVADKKEIGRLVADRFVGANKANSGAVFVADGTTARDGKLAVEFSFDGSDGADETPCSGRGWMTMETENLTGMFFFHLGDESALELSRRPGQKENTD